MSEEPESKNNTETGILYYIGKFPIKKVNNITLGFNEIEYKKLALAAHKTGLPIKKILALQGSSCTACGNDNISIIVPRNLLSIRGINFNENDEQK